MIVPKLEVHEVLSTFYEQHSARRRRAIKERTACAAVMREEYALLKHGELEPSEAALLSVRTYGVPRKVGAPTVEEKNALDRNRRALALIKARERAAERERIGRENAAIMHRLRCAISRTDDDVRDDATGAARRVAAAHRTERSESGRRALASANASQRSRILTTAAATDSDITDESAGEQRLIVAHASQARKAERSRRLADENAIYRHNMTSAHAATDNGRRAATTGGSAATPASVLLATGRSNDRPVARV